MKAGRPTNSETGSEDDEYSEGPEETEESKDSECSKVPRESEESELHSRSKLAEVDEALKTAISALSLSEEEETTG